MTRFGKTILAYVIALHVLCAVMLFESNFITNLRISGATSQQPGTALNYYNRLVEYHLRMDSSIPDGATIFIGDSITQSLATSAVSDLSVNYGIGSDTTVGVLKRLTLYESINIAKAVVLAIGINDLKQSDNDEVLGNYKKILNLLSKKQFIIVSAIMPVDERVVHTASVTNERIDEINSEIGLLVDTYENVYFVNSGILLKNRDGNLKAEFHVGDGVHINAAGYQVWIRLLREVLGNT